MGRSALACFCCAVVALAASLAAVLFIMPSQMPDNNNAQQLEEIIAQNNYLQQKLDATDFSQGLKVKYNLLRNDIQNLDQAIQRAYINGSTDQEKTKLWKGRQKLIKQLLSEEKKKSNFRI